MYINNALTLPSASQLPADAHPIRRSVLIHGLPRIVIRKMPQQWYKRPQQQQECTMEAVDTLQANREPKHDLMVFGGCYWWWYSNHNFFDSCVEMPLTAATTRQGIFLTKKRASTVTIDNRREVHTSSQYPYLDWVLATSVRELDSNITILQNVSTTHHHDCAILPLILAGSAPSPGVAASTILCYLWCLAW